MTEIRRSVEQALQKKTNANRRLHALNQLEERLNHTLADVRQALGGQAVTQSPPATGRFIERGDLIVDLNRQVALVNHTPLDLTLIEYSLLAYLVKAAPRVVTPQKLVSQVHGYASESDEASDLVRPHVSRLRHKLRQAGMENVIQTIRGRGYALE